MTPRIDLAVVTSFHPGPGLIDLVETIAPHVGSVLVVDDATGDEATEILRPLVAHERVEVVRKSENRGLADSLNVGFAEAMASGAGTVVTFDQDATIEADLLPRLAAAVAEVAPRRWGVLGPGRVNGFVHERGSGLHAVSELVQSGAVFNVAALEECGPADERLFIDAIDTDLCLRLRAGGYGVFADDRIAMSHRIGTGGRTIGLFGRRIAVTDHAAARRYYMTRNKLEMFRRYGWAEKRWALRAAFWFVVSIALSLTVSGHRLATLRATSRGVGDFLLGRSGRDPRDTAVSVGHGVAVVIVTHNGMRHLDEQLDSIAAQSDRPDHVYLVDDHSTDGSRQFVVEYCAAQAIPLTVVVPPLRRSGDAYTRIARNFAAGMTAAAARYQFIVMTDQDDVWDPDRLKRQRYRLESTGALMTVGNGELIDRDGALLGSTLRDRFPVHPGWDDAGAVTRLRSVLRQSMATGAASMVDRRIVTLGTPIPRGWLHDRWLSLVAVAHDGLDVDHETVLQYRVYPEQAVGLAGRTNVSPFRRLAEGYRKPLLTVRKVIHLSGPLRRSVPHPDLRSDLSAPRVVRTYLRRINAS